MVSQPKPANLEKAPFNEIVKKHKVTIDYTPFIKINGVTLKEFRSQKVDVLSHTAVIFTGRAMVDNFFRVCEEARISIPETMKYFCNTEAIALYLQKYIIYRKRKIFFSDGNFNNFMELIIKHKDEKFILAMSEPHNPEIPETMERLNLQFSKIILSRTVAADLDDVDVRNYDLLVFYSPSEISTLVGKFGTENMPHIATFGDNTTRTAIEAGLTVSIMAPSVQCPSMVKAADILITTVKSGKEVEPVSVALPRKSEEFIKAQEAKPQRKTRARRKPVEEGVADAKPAK